MRRPENFSSPWPVVLWVSIAVFSVIGCRNCPPYGKVIYYNVAYEYTETLIAHGLLAFYSDMHRFPLTEEGWRTLLGPPTEAEKLRGWNGPYVPWDGASFDILLHPVEYTSLRGGRGALFHFQGKDEEKGTPDDLFVIFEPMNLTRDAPSRVRSAVEAVEVHLRDGLACYRDAAGSYPAFLTDLVKQREKDYLPLYVPHPWKGPYVSPKQFALAEKAFGQYNYNPFREEFRDRGFSIVLWMDTGSDKRGSTPELGFHGHADVQLGFLKKRDDSFDVFIARRYLGNEPMMSSIQEAGTVSNQH